MKIIAMAQIMKMRVEIKPFHESLYKNQTASNLANSLQYQSYLFLLTYIFSAARAEEVVGRCTHHDQTCLFLYFRRNQPHSSSWLISHNQGCVALLPQTELWQNCDDDLNCRALWGVWSDQLLGCQNGSGWFQQQSRC